VFGGRVRFGLIMTQVVRQLELDIRPVSRCHPFPLGAFVCINLQRTSSFYRVGNVKYVFGNLWFNRSFETLRIMLKLPFSAAKVDISLSGSPLIFFW